MIVRLDEHASSLALERELHGEITGSSSDHWRAHIAACAHCQQQLDAMRALERVYQRARERRKTQRLWWLLVPAFAAALLLVRSEEFTPKGHPLSAVYQGEQMQMVWTGAPGYLMVVGIEPSGEVTVLLPHAKVQSQQRIGGSVGIIHNARIIALFAQEPFSQDHELEAVAAGRSSLQIDELTLP